MSVIIYGKQYDNPLDVKHLRLSSMGIQNLNGKDLLHFPNVEVLDLYENRLTILPDEINYLTKLRIFRVYNNRLVIMPDMSNLIYLEELNITNNYLSAIHPSIFKLPRLQNLYIGGNYIAPDVYLADKFKIYCDSYKTTEFVDSSPGEMNLKSSGVSDELLRINRHYANKNPDNPTTFDSYDNFIAENNKLTKKTYEFTYELISRSANFIKESNNLALVNIGLLRGMGVDVNFDGEHNYKTLCQINDYMFDLTDQANINFDITTKETAKFITQLEYESAKAKLEISNLELTNQKLVAFNMKLKGQLANKSGQNSITINSDKEQNKLLKNTIKSLEQRLNEATKNSDTYKFKVQILNRDIEKLRNEKKDLHNESTGLFARKKGKNH